MYNPHSALKNLKADLQSACSAVLPLALFAALRGGPVCLPYIGSAENGPHRNRETGPKPRLTETAEQQNGRVGIDLPLLPWRGVAGSKT